MTDNSDLGEPAIRVAMLPRDTNGAGTIFGGVILSHIDMAGAIEAQENGLHKDRYGRFARGRICLAGLCWRSRQLLYPDGKDRQNLNNGESSG